MKRFTNKTVLITGGTSGMGFATARRLLDEGAYVVVTGRDRTRLDHASLPELDALIRQIETWRGTLDAVFAFDHTVDVNFKGVFFTVQKALPLLRDGGAIVINASWTLHRGLPIASVYSATKAAVHNLARTLGADLAPRGIRVNSVSPGYIDTEMYRGANPEPGAEEANSAEVPLGSLGYPDEVAAAVAFLASDDASYITRQDLVVDGGLVGSVATGGR